MQNLFARFVKDESGATAIEYGLIAAIIGVGIISGAASPARSPTPPPAWPLPRTKRTSGNRRTSG